MLDGDLENKTRSEI